MRAANAWARYSFLGFGEGLTLEFRADSDDVLLNGAARAKPGNAAEWLALMREALALSPELKPAIPEIPFNGGLVGAAGYDVVRYFERLPPNRSELDGGLPQGAFVAPRSVLVFDHLTRRVALLHAGSEAERQALRREVIRALRGGVSAVRARNGLSPAESSFAKTGVSRRRGPLQGAHRRWRHLPDRALVAVQRTNRSRPLPDLPRHAAAQSLPIHVLLRTRRPQGRRFFARSAGQARWPPGLAAADRGHPAARRNAVRRYPPRTGTARRPQGERRAHHARRSRAQRSRQGSRTRGPCTSIRTARSSATATSCTSSAA